MCALWIKKLCDFANPPNKDPGKSVKAYTIQQQIRNSYSQLLLSMLEANKSLSHPFNEKPPTGPLKYLVRNLGLEERGVGMILRCLGLAEGIASELLTPRFDE